MTPQQTPDIIALLIFLGALIFGPEVAAVVGPYVAIIAAAALGASFALSRREKTTRTDAAKFFAQVVGLAVLITVGLTQVAQAYYPALHGQVLLVPVALIIGYIGDGWPGIFDAVIKKLLGALDFFRKSQP
jgi:uncharacterized membrane protein YiaA